MEEGGFINIDSLNQKILISYYADDFTGATDSMEALATEGLRTILFSEPPEFDFVIENFPDIDCIGIMGMTRAMRTDILSLEVNYVMSKLVKYDTIFSHYKICSTLDSSFETGNIGRAIEISREIFGKNVITPLIVGTPYLGRYTVFGNHFAQIDEEVYRLDRHPVMSNHPITPMDESDICIHLAKQVRFRTDLLNVNELDKSEEELIEIFNEKVDSGAEVVLFDTLTKNHLRTIGNLLFKYKEDTAYSTPLFITGSSGVQHAIVESMKEKGLLNNSEMQKKENPKMSWDIDYKADAADQIFVVSGSCSPLTQKQIEKALNSGFIGLKLPIAKVITDPDRIFNDLFEQAEKIFNDGKSLIIYTVSNPNEVETVTNEDKEKFSLNLGIIYGKLIREVYLRTGVKRAVIAGGDTSGYAVKELGIYALEMKSSIARAAPLCKCYTEDENLNQLELALKGGQLGQLDYFERVLEG